MLISAEVMGSFTVKQTSFDNEEYNVFYSNFGCMWIITEDFVVGISAAYLV